jgi:hypothetical protein
MRNYTLYVLNYTLKGENYMLKGENYTLIDGKLCPKGGQLPVRTVIKA